MSDYSPPYDPEEERQIERQDKLMVQLNNIPLRKLNIGDIVRLIDIVRPTYDTLYLSKEDIKTVEKIMKKTKDA